MSYLRVLVLSLALAAPISILPGDAPLVGASDVQAQTTSGSLTQALGSKKADAVFSSLYKALRNFAGFLLIIGVVVAGVLFIVGKPGPAMVVFVGAVVVYGGAYVIDLVNRAMNTEAGGSVSITIPCVEGFASNAVEIIKGVAALV